MWKTLTSGPILVHIYPLFYINLHVKNRSNIMHDMIKIFCLKKKKNVLFFVWVMLGPYIKSMGTRGNEMSSNAALITMKTYVEQGETILKPVFHI